MIIDDRKNNLEGANRVGFLYKIKFLFYTLVTCVSSVMLMLKFLGVTGFLNKLRIIK